MTCSIPTCKNIRRLMPPESNITFHKFPKDERLHEYMRIVGKETAEWKPTMLICSKHFKDDDFVLMSDRKFLNVRAIPSVEIQLNAGDGLKEQSEPTSTEETGANSSNEMDNVCRACTTTHGPMESLYSFYKAYPMTFTLSEIFTSCTSLEVKRDDGLPEQLCLECAAQVKKWYTFKETSVKSDIKLRSSLLKRVINESDKMALPNNLNSMDVTPSEAELENVITESSPLFILVVKNSDSNNQENNEVIIKQQLSLDDINGINVEEAAESLDETPEELVETEDNTVETEDNLYSVKRDHTYANRKKVSDQPLKHYYHCRWCFEIFTNLKRYEKHVLEEHGEAIKCNSCNKIFQSNDKLSLHVCSDSADPECSELESNESSTMAEIITVKRRILKKDPIRCTYCTKTFKHLWTLKTHMLIHTGERPHMCHVCGKRFSQKPHLKTHYFTHTGVKNYICEVCGKKFATVSFLKNHMRHHDDKLKKHRCTQCSKAFFLPGELKTHISIHTGERPFKCLICSKSFRLKGAMKTHQLRHGSCELQDVNRPFWCNMCNRTFTKEIYLENHLTTVHGAESQKQKFLCKICGREFRTKNTLKMHSIRHTSSRPFLCTICNRNFKDEANLIAHIKFHARPKPFECETCHKRFIDRCALRVHNRTHTGERPFACELCEKRFTVKRSLEAHVRCHTGERPFACSICKNTFSQRCSLQTHMLLMHNCDP